MNDVAHPGHVPNELFSDVDIYDLPGAADDPQAAWKALHRDGGPGVIWTPRNGGHWIVTSGRKTLELMADIENLSARELSVPPGNSIYPLIPNQSDEPEHRHYRNIVMPFVTPHAVAALSGNVRALARSLIQALQPRGACDFMAKFARHVPMLIFLQLMELPADDREYLIERADVMTRSNDTAKRIIAQQEIMAYLQERIDRRRARPGQDMLSAIIHGKVGGRPMNHAEIMGESMDLLFGGLDTVAAMTGFIMRFLARHPTHRRQLIEARTLLPKAVEELLRRHSVATVARRVLKTIEINGVTLHAGDMVVLSTVMHAMDETLWPAPLSVDFNRPAQQIGTFGLGVHTCIGARLARSEVTIMLDEWLTHIPDFEIAAEDDGRGLSGAVNALSSLRLVWPIAN